MSKGPNDANNPDDGGLGDGSHGGFHGLPTDGKKTDFKMVLSQSAQEVKFADMFGFTLSPAHGVIKFGVVHPESREIIVHTQIALTPQGMVALSQALQKNIENFKNLKPGKGPSAN